MKKRIFALVLVLLMLIPFVVACGGNKDTDTNKNTNSNTVVQKPDEDDEKTETATQTQTQTQTQTNTGSNTGTGSGTQTQTPGGTESGGKVSTKDNPSKAWSGKTLDVLASRWYGTPSKEEAGTWSQPEFYVTGYLNADKYGRKINDAVWARQEFIQATYGVTVKWHDGKNDGVLQNELQGGLEAGNAKFHIALTRMFETQSLIAAETVYDIANSKYIDLSASYYNQASVESFSVYGHTFFVAGDFSFLDEETATLIFYNQALSESIKTFPNLYKKVDNYEWTISELAKWAKQIGKDDDGTQGYQDTDTYGFGSTGLAGFFQSSGIQQVSTRPVAGKDYKEYYISLNDNATAITDLVTELVAIKSSTWARTGWEGGYGAMEESFKKGKLLFYHEVAQKIHQFPAQNDTFKVGVLPMPMLYEDQGAYYAPLCSQATVMCVPKATLDREMSEYFFDVLSWTGQEYVINAYHETLELKLYDDGKTSREDALRMLTNHIFPGMSYDQGYMNHAMGSKFMTDVQTETVDSGSASKFTQLYAEKYTDAAKKLNDTKTGWNTNAKNYKD